MAPSPTPIPAPVSAPGDTELAHSGVDSLPFAFAGAGLLGAGAIAALLARRARRHG
ncbi:hypothetical protein [Microbacterium sp. CIAB417]|uniref:hypothetical protein n=1 Tax=Microbacterium sp. CIAB417 TaxID=2860287 RepID=UPI001FAE2D9B|nr:hypothetical protein [Microbacterium sp. CIAB417]